MTFDEHIEQILRLTQSVQDPAFLVGAHHAQGAVLFVFGEVASAREHCEQVITLYNPQQQRSYALYGIDLGVGGRGKVLLAELETT